MKENDVMEVKPARLLKILTYIADDPSIPEKKKVHKVIHLTALVCAVIAVQPIPFADLLILTPIQLVMVVALNRILGGPVGKSGAKEILSYLVAVVGWGLLSQQVILGLYKTIIPFIGGLTTIPLVYAATAGLGYAVKAVLEARLNDQELSKEEIIKIKKEAEAEARARQRKLSLAEVKNEIEEIRSSAMKYESYKNELADIIREMKTKNGEIGEELGGVDIDDEIDAESILKEFQKLMESEKKKTNEYKQKYDGLKKKVELRRATQDRLISIIARRYKTCYPSINIEGDVFKRLVQLPANKINLFERQLGYLQYDPGKASFRGKVAGTDIKELSFDKEGRIYLVGKGTRYQILMIGDKNSQGKDISRLKNMS